MISVYTLAFTEYGAEVTFTEGDDLRKDGALQMVRTLNIAPHPDYEDALADLREKAAALVKDAMEDFHTSPAVDLDDEDGGDDEPGMGWSADG
jgi:hypothetical protein